MTYVKSDKKIFTVLNDLINISAASIRIRRVIIKEKFRNYELRPQLHLFISAPFGQFKSTLLNEISKSYPTTLLTNLSFPGLVGSIDRTTHQIIPGSAWEARNKILLLDEFTATRQSMVTDALLQLLENQFYSRKIATFSADQEEIDDDLYFKVRKGAMELRTRFAAIFATMKDIRYMRKQVTRALISRCIPIRYEMDKSEVDQVLDGKRILEPKQYKTKEKVVVKNRDYQRIREIIDEGIEIEKVKKPEEILARTVGDCCRVFAVLGEHDENLYRWVLRLKSTCI